MDIIKFKFSIRGERSEFKDIGLNSNENIFEGEIKIENEDRYISNIDFLIKSGFPFSREDYLLMAKGKENSVLQEKIIITEVENSNLVEISFEGAKLLGLSLRKPVKEKYGTTIIKLDSIKLKYENEVTEIPFTYYYLNSASYKLIYQNYSFQVRENKTSWSAKSTEKVLRINRFLVRFGFDFIFDHNTHFDKAIINKIPFLKVTVGDLENISSKEFDEFAEIICSILSFSRNEIIDFSARETYIGNFAYFKYKIIDNSNKNKTPNLGLYHLGFKEGYLELLEKSNFNHIYKTNVEFNNHISKYIFSK